MINIKGSEVELSGSVRDVMSEFMAGIMIMLDGISEEKDIKLIILSDMFRGVAKEISGEDFDDEGHLDDSREDRTTTTDREGSE